jgi:hypothetical protein
MHVRNVQRKFARHLSRLSSRSSRIAERDEAPALSSRGFLTGSLPRATETLVDLLNRSDLGA